MTGDAAARPPRFTAEPYTTENLYAVTRGGVLVAKFVIEEEAIHYAAYRNAMLEKHNTTALPPPDIKELRQ